MKYERFSEIWTTLVTNRTPAGNVEHEPVLNNGVSEHTVSALVAAADGDHSQFDDIAKTLIERDI